MFSHPFTAVICKEETLKILYILLAI